MISAYLSVALSLEHRPALLEKGIFLRPSEEGLKEPVDKTCRIAVAYRHPYRLLAVIRLAPTKARPVFENSVLEGVLPPRVCRHFQPQNTNALCRTELLEFRMEKSMPWIVDLFLQ